MLAKMKAALRAIGEQVAPDKPMELPQVSMSKSRGRSKVARHAQNVDSSYVPISDEYVAVKDDYLTVRGVTLKDLAVGL